jgi:hypothetical protein
MPQMLVTIGITDKLHYRLGVRHHPGSDPDWHLLPSGFDDPLKAYDMMHKISAGNPERIRIFRVEPVDTAEIQARLVTRGPDE